MNKIIFLLLLTPLVSFSQNKVSSEFIDSIVEVSMRQFPQAGIAVGVIQNGEVTHLKGYGVASSNSNTLVDENTLFAIASNSKAFTATAIGSSHTVPCYKIGKMSFIKPAIIHI